MNLKFIPGAENYIICHLRNFMTPQTPKQVLLFAIISSKNNNYLFNLKWYFAKVSFPVTLKNALII